MNELCIIGHPSIYGGADTELDHQITCWQHMGVKVHICHTEPDDPEADLMKMEERGCVYHKPKDWASLEGLHCISYCNGEFLKDLPTIKKYAKSTTFVNCMTYNFDAEIEMHKQGLIDFHLYQTEHAYNKVSRRLVELNAKYRPMMVTPYFRLSDFPFHATRPQDGFRFGRISRIDLMKFNANQLRIYDKITAPVPKYGLIMGWDTVIAKRLGVPEAYIATVIPGWITPQKFYEFCDVIIMSSDTYENLPRVGFEAMASGSVLIVDNRGGWKLQVENEKTGWLCDNEEDFVYKASRAAFEIEERNEFRLAALEKLKNGWGLEAASKSWQLIFDEWDKV